LGTFHEVHPESGKKFAASVVVVVKKYGLNGIDIDDEYYGDQFNRARVETDPKTRECYLKSLAMVTSELRKKIPDKILSMALHRDWQHFFQECWQDVCTSHL
jgi:GH18 family chitinase